MPLASAVGQRHGCNKMVTHNLVVNDSSVTATRVYAPPRNANVPRSVFLKRAALPLF